MTNEQLAVLLRQYHSRFADALERADASLDDGVEREARWRYVGKTAYPFTLARFFSNRLTHPEDWEEYPGDASALNPLREVLDGLEMSIAQLETSGGSEEATHVTCRLEVPGGSAD